MVRLWYPTAQSRQPAAVYLTPGVASVSTDFLTLWFRALPLV
jgi:hypothetical protein